MDRRIAMLIASFLILIPLDIILTERFGVLPPLANLGISFFVAFFVVSLWWISFGRSKK